VVLLLCIAGIVVVVFLRRQCIREAQAAANNDGIGNASNGGLIRTSESTLNQTNGTAGGASTISKAARGGGVNPRSQSLKPLMDSVDCNLDAGGGGPMFVSRIEPDHWKNQMFCHTGLTQLGWPVGEPPPSAHSPSLPPPPPPPNMMMTHQQSIEAGLITPPYTTDSSLDLRSPDIIPPPIIGKMQLPFHVSRRNQLMKGSCFLFLNSSQGRAILDRPPYHGRTKASAWDPLRHLLERQPRRKRKNRTSRGATRCPKPFANRTIFFEGRRQVVQPLPTSVKVSCETEKEEKIWHLFHTKKVFFHLSRSVSRFISTFREHSSLITSNRLLTPLPPYSTSHLSTSSRYSLLHYKVRVWHLAPVDPLNTKCRPPEKNDDVRCWPMYRQTSQWTYRIALERGVYTKHTPG
jgi:hypothetical protein